MCPSVKNPVEVLVARRLRCLMDDRGFSIEQFCDSAGLDPILLKLALDGSGAELKLSDWVSIAFAFNLQLHELFSPH